MHIQTTQCTRVQALVALLGTPLPELPATKATQVAGRTTPGPQRLATVASSSHGGGTGASRRMLRQEVH
jgi:hypothetical protein